MTEHVEIREMQELEVEDLHSDLVFVLRRAGLAGHSLDEATAEAFSAIVLILERERITAKRRAKDIHIVATRAPEDTPYA